MSSSRRFRHFAFLVLLLALLAPVSGRADGSQSLGESFRLNYPGGGIVSGGVGLAGGRGRTGGWQPSYGDPSAPRAGSIAISGVPDGATVEHAFLYWATLGAQDDAVTFAGQTVTGNEIGTSPDPVDYMPNPSFASHVNRADVASFVPGNGTYAIDGVGDVDAGTDAQGASLVVVYSRAAASTTTDIVIEDGSYTGGAFVGRQDLSASIPLSVASQPFSASLHTAIANAQNPNAFPNPDGITAPGPLTVNARQIAPANFAVATDGLFWDDKSFDVSNVLTQGGSSADITLHSQDEQIVWIYTAITIERSSPANGSIHIDVPGPGGTWNSSIVNFSGSSSGATSVSLSEGQADFGTFGVEPNGHWARSISLGNGSHTVVATALDMNNNPVASASVQFTVDGGGPPPSNVAITAPENNSIAASGSVKIEGTATGVTAVQLTDGSAQLGNVAVIASKWSLNASFADGSHTVNAVGLDSQGGPSGSPTFVQFAVDTSPPTIEMADGDLPFAPPGTNTQVNIAGVDVRGAATDSVAVARVDVSYQMLGSSDPPTTTQANCSGCMPSYCPFCGNQRAEWNAHLQGMPTGIYSITATAYDLAGHSVSTPARTVVELFGDGGPGGAFGDDGPLSSPPNCFGPLGETPACFDPFGDGGPFGNGGLLDGGGPLGLFGPDSPVCFGPIKDTFCG